MRRSLVVVALGIAVSCRGSHATPHDAAPPPGVARARDAAQVVVAPPDAAPPPKARPPLDPAEIAALPGTIEVGIAKSPNDNFSIVSIDPTGHRAPRTLAEGDAFAPVPGRMHLAVETTSDGDPPSNLFVLLGDRPEQARRIERDVGGIKTVAESPDGKTLYYEGYGTSGFFISQVTALDVATAHEKALTKDHGGAGDLSLSPDGKQLAYTASPDGNAEVYTMYPSTGATTQLTHFYKDDWSPRWSPDGAWIAFLSDREGSPRVFLVHPDGTSTETAHADAVVGEEQGPIWSPDGSQLGYTVSTRDGASEVWVVDVATRTAHRVSAAGSVDQDPSWAPDSKHLVYESTRDQRIDLWVARADGSAESRLTDTPGEEWRPCWRP